MNLDAPLESIKGVGEKTAEQLRAAGLLTVRDLISFLPRKYEDFSEVVKIANIKPGMRTIRAKCEKIETKRVRRGMTVTTATLVDASGKLRAVWFNQPYRVKQLQSTDEEFFFSGTFEFSYNRFQLSSPSAEKVSEVPVSTDRIVPVYRAVKGLKSHLVRKLLVQLRPYMEVLKDPMPEAIIRRQKLRSFSQAVVALHFPEDNDDIRRGRERLGFDELFQLLLAAQLNKRSNSELQGWKIPFNKQAVQQFVAELPFALTDAQRRSAWEVVQDFERETPMNRLLQGDVGSGKTIVALLCMLIVKDNGFQSCIMAPTEILAQQHYASISEALGENSNIKVAFLSGSVKNKARSIILEELASGATDIIIGTHALIEPTVKFHNLGLTIVDEQHRFGVAQRAAIWQKGQHLMPHVLVMTATPIPRTLAMTIYGDLDVSVIDELPPGRKEIKTMHFYDSGRPRLIEFLHKEIANGRQVYIVYPLIEESEKLDLQSLQNGYEQLLTYFPPPQFQISVVHGRMKAADKDWEMQRFIKKETQIMVATTVIEVGVNVPNASVMVIENTERFGLSQLHQLRGRVGRGAKQSYCILMSDYKISKEGKERIHTMVRTNNGFEIAEADLKQRGPGDLQGTQQSGILDFRLLNIGKDSAIIETARQIAMRIIDRDPQLEMDVHYQLKLH
ncbi:ATP-dependent DNA helicase RecG, partial [Candidatus Saccharibacteria bacterium]|nr:ATP-dependent DNA helicase RecG [Candidatus Saccharibacteria bacterium]